MTLVQFVNENTILTDLEIVRIMDALQIQANRDMEASWGFGKNYINKFVKPLDANPHEMVMAFLDDSDQANALGYHVTTSENAPLAKIFVKTDMSYGYTISITASHEYLEMLCDPMANWKITSPDMLKDYMVEVCDACEAEKYAYDINGVKVSDFVLPPWFEMPARTVPVRYDFCDHISSPWELLDGGYIAYLDMKTFKWVQQMGPSGRFRQDETEYSSKSRFTKLQVPRNSWTPSTRI